jgi:hypothetical protein
LDIQQFYAALLHFVAVDCGYLLQDAPSSLALTSHGGESQPSPTQQMSPISTAASSSTSDVLSPRPVLSVSGEIVNSSASPTVSSVPSSSSSKATARALNRVQALAQHQVEGERRALNISRHFHFLANAIFPVLDAQIGKRMAKV